MPPILLRDQRGREVWVDNPERAALLGDLGYAPVAGETGQAERALDANLEAEYGNHPVRAYAAGVASGATLGLLKDRTFSGEQVAERNATEAGIGEIVGMIAPAVLTGGASAGATGARTAAGLVAKGAGYLPAGAAARVGTGAARAAGLAEGSVASGALAAATEGAVSNGAMALTDAVLGDDPVAPEAILSEVGLASIYGFGAGGILGGAGALVGKGGGRLARSVGYGADEAAKIEGAGRNALDEFLERGDIPVRARAAQGAADDLVARMEREAAEAEDAFRFERKIRSRENMRAEDWARGKGEEAAQRARAEWEAGKEAHDASHEAALKNWNSEELAKRRNPVYEWEEADLGPVFRKTKAATDGLFADAALDPSLARSAQKEIAAARAAYRDAALAFKGGDAVAFEPLLLKYQKAADDLSRRLGGEALEIPRKVRIVQPEAPRPVKEPYPDFEAPAPWEVNKKVTPFESDQPYWRQREAARIWREGPQLADAARWTPDEFRAAARNLGGLLKEAGDSGASLRLKITDLAKQARGAVDSGGAELSGLDLAGVARALKLGDDVADALQTLPPSVRPLGDLWVSARAMKSAPVNPLAGPAAEAPERLGFFGKVARQAAGRVGMDVGRGAGGAVGAALGYQGARGVANHLLGAAAWALNARAAVMGRIGAAAAAWVPGASRRTVTPVLSILNDRRGGGEKHATVREAHDAAVSRVRAWASPSGRDQAYSAISDLRQVSGRLADGVYAATVRASEYLASKAPRDPGTVVRVGRSAWKPSEEQMASFAQHLRGTVMPMDVVEDFFSGRVTRESAEALRHNHPALFAEVAAAVFQRVADIGEDLSLDERVRLSTLLGKPLDSCMRPQFIAAQAAMFTERQGSSPPVGPGGPLSTPSSSPGTTGGGGLTPAQRNLTR